MLYTSLALFVLAMVSGLAAVAIPIEADALVAELVFVACLGTLSVLVVDRLWGAPRWDDAVCGPRGGRSTWSALTPTTACSSAHRTRTEDDDGTRDAKRSGPREREAFVNESQDDTGTTESTNDAEEIEPEPVTPRMVRRRRGFAVMSPERVRTIARAGGVASHSAGTAHEFTSEEARVAGRKGGLAPHRPRRSKTTGGGASAERASTERD